MIIVILDFTQVSISASSRKSLCIPPVNACFAAEAGVRLSKNWNKMKYCAKICRRNEGSASCRQLEFS